MEKYRFSVCGHACPQPSTRPAVVRSVSGRLAIEQRSKLYPSYRPKPQFPYQTTSRRQHRWRTQDREGAPGAHRPLSRCAWKAVPGAELDVAADTHRAVRHRTDRQHILLPESPSGLPVALGGGICLPESPSGSPSALGWQFYLHLRAAPTRDGRLPVGVAASADVAGTPGATWRTSSSWRRSGAERLGVIDASVVEKSETSATSAKTSEAGRVAAPRPSCNSGR